jgi:hypothetical protein
MPLNAAPVAILSAGVAIPAPPLLPSIAKSEKVMPLELISNIGLPLDEFLRFNVVPNLPAPCSQMLALIETTAGFMMQVPGGIITVAFPKTGLAAEVSAACSAAESSVDPSHFIPVAKTGFIITLALISESALRSGAVRADLGGACPYAAPTQLRKTLITENVKLRIRNLLDSMAFTNVRLFTREMCVLGITPRKARIPRQKAASRV